MNMSIFSIRDIENFTGIKAHTLRIWEQRYQLLCCKRKESKHRFYDHDDLKRLLKIAYLYSNGYKISQIASLPEEEISKLALELKANAESYGIFVNQLTDAAIALDTARFEKVLYNIILYIGFEKCITQVVFPVLQRMNVLWLAGHVIPAQEHFAKALIVKKMLVAIDGLEAVPYTEGRRVLLFAPIGDFQEIALLFAQYRLKKQQVPHIYLGTNVSLEVLKDYGESQPFTQLYCHQANSLVRCDMDEYAMELSALFPDKEIFFCGAKTCQLGELPPNVHILKCQNAVAEFVG
ncbi:MAG: MerR family transcriptional regulator [Chitinophagaceae bacterium]